MTATDAPARTLTYVGAITEAVPQAMREDPLVFLCGEDIGAYGGVFGTARGLQKEFGPERVFDTPISEEAIIGLGVGAAATGCRPVVDIMFMDFMAEAGDEILNQMAKM